MATIRLPETIWDKVSRHLFSTPGEHFGFLLARQTFSCGEPVFQVRDVVLVPDGQVTIDRDGWRLSTEAILTAVNAAARAGMALIETHNHGGDRPRFSRLDRRGFEEFVPYVLGSLPGRAYGAMVWGDTAVSGEFFLDGRAGQITSVIVTGEQLRQIVSRDDDDLPVVSAFHRQLPWFTAEGQRALGRLRIGVAGLGGTGSQLIQNLVYLGVRDFLLVEDDEADDTSMNRLITASAADIATPKGILARRLIKSVAPAAHVVLIPAKVQSATALDACQGVDVLFGCFDNDAPRLILNELALAYGIAYFDLAVGIDVEAGRVTTAGGRVAIVRPGGPCLNCMGEIDAEEVRFFLSSPEQQSLQIARGYVHGLDVKAPSVVSLNATVAGLAASEFAVYVSGLRSVNAYTELDLLGTGRAVAGQWVTPRRVQQDPGCVQCAVAGLGDAAGVGRYAVTDRLGVAAIAANATP